MNKIVAVLIACVLAFGLTGCSSTKASLPTESLDEKYTYGEISIKYPSVWTIDDSNDGEFIWMHPPYGGVLQITATELQNGESITYALFDKVYKEMGVGDVPCIVGDKHDRQTSGETIYEISELEIKVNGEDHRGYIYLGGYSEIVYCIMVAVPVDLYEEKNDMLKELTYGIVLTPTKTESKAEPEKKSANIYSSGTYKIGTDLPAGEYLLVQSNSTTAYICVYPDSKKSEILENDNFSGQYYITVYDGQYLEVNRAIFMKADEIGHEIKSSITPGMYKVGVDIPAGEYSLSQTGGTMAYLCVYDNSSADRDIVTNDNFKGNNYVTVSEGQYLFINRCNGEHVG